MVDREGVVSDRMLTVQNITNQLQSQTLSESHTNFSSSSQDENAAKIRHHSEPHPPISLLSDSNKKVKIIAVGSGAPKQGVAVTSILLSSQPNDSVKDLDGACCNPPNKRQCRSMSIPNDGELHTRWLQTQARSRLHRPLALRPNSGGSRPKSHHLSHQVYKNAARGLPPTWPSLVSTDSSTPPESPRSRPSSASSGYFDSPLNSLNNLNKNRCESLQTLPSMGHSASGSGADSDSRPSLRGLSAISMPSVADSWLHSNLTQPLPLRCQSQPCVIHERRCGTKRRRCEDQRPSINFAKMTEMKFGKDHVRSDLTARTASPLKIRSGRHGHIFPPDRVLQTIASSPQDVNYISSIASLNSQHNTPTTSIDSTLPGAHSLHHTMNDSDSGCSTTDDELCDITNKMVPTVQSKSHSCSHTGSQNRDLEGCGCLGASDTEQDVIFAMEPNQDSELDLDMIENN